MNRDTKDSIGVALAFFACLGITGVAILFLWAISDLLKEFLPGE